MWNQNAILCLSLSLILAGTIHAQSNSKIVFDVVDVAGNTRGESDHYILQDAIGQPSPVGVSDSRNMVLMSGFLAVRRLPSTKAVSVDFTDDGAVDFDDFFAFSAVFGQAATGDNAKFDLNIDGKIDFDDFFIIAASFNQKAPKRAAKLALVVDKVETPEGKVEYSLDKNYPNPFNPQTQITYYLSEAGRVQLTVYNLLGQIVRTIVDGVQAAGRRDVLWDGRDGAGRPVASGIYFYRIEIREFSAVRRMVLIK